VQEFDSNFLEAKVRGLESPVGAACWYLLYRDLEREDRPVDRNLTKKERERAVIACYKAAGDHLLARREAGSLRLSNKMDWGLPASAGSRVSSIGSFPRILRLPDANPKCAL
jgi:hypothetical protein